MNSPDFSRVDQLQSQVEPAAAHIIFVGTKAHFPDCLCRLVVAEIEGCSFSRLGSAAELVNMIEGQNARPQLIVIDDSLWAKLDEALLNTVHQDPGPWWQLPFVTRNLWRGRFLASRVCPGGSASFPWISTSNPG